MRRYLPVLYLVLGAVTVYVCQGLGYYAANHVPKPLTAPVGLTQITPSPAPVLPAVNVWRADRSNDHSGPPSVWFSGPPVVWFAADPETTTQFIIVENPSRTAIAVLRRY